MCVYMQQVCVCVCVYVHAARVCVCACVYVHMSLIPPAGPVRQVPRQVLMHIFAEAWRGMLKPILDLLISFTLRRPLLPSPLGQPEAGWAGLGAVSAYGSSEHSG